MFAELVVVRPEVFPFTSSLESTNYERAKVLSNTMHFLSRENGSFSWLEVSTIDSGRAR